MRETLETFQSLYHQSADIDDLLRICHLAEFQHQYAGFVIIFGGRSYSEYKTGIFPHPQTEVSSDQLRMPDGFRKMRYLKFIGFPIKAEELKKLEHHKIDFVLKIGDPPYEYYVSDASPKGYVLEQMFKASFVPPGTRMPAEKKEIKTSAIRYIDWLFPGILAMNMMFSAPWGVGYIVVRYRKNGVSKRLKVTPLNAFEYLSAQALSRIFLLKEYIKYLSLFYLYPISLGL